MMESRKFFFLVLYLLMYSSFSTADLNPELVNQVEKGIDTSVQLLETIDTLAELTGQVNQGAKIIQNVFQVFDKLTKIAASLSFVGSLVSFIFAFIPQNDPTLEFMKVEFSEVNRKLDSLALQINSLGEEIEWAVYASVYSKDENNIKNSWAQLKEFIDSASKAETEMDKTRLAERFTTFYENAGTENSVYNFHSYLTENNPASLNKNLLLLVMQQSEGNFKTLMQFTAYFTSLMVTGLQLKLHYYALKGYDGKPVAVEAVKQLTNVKATILKVLIECTDSFEVWAEKDVQKIGTKPLPENINLANSIKEHLDNKFTWYDWTVIVHDKKDEEERTYGNSINVIAQNKVVIHLLHREKGFSVNEGIKAEMEREWNSKGRLCHEKILEWPVIFQDTSMQHVEYIHEPSDYAQTIENRCLQLKCLDSWVETTFTVYLKSQKFVEYNPCSNVNCNKGECRQIKDTSTGICKCDKMFYGPTCQGSVQDDIDYALLETEIIGITYQPVPDLTTIYYDLKEMKKYVGDLVNSLRDDIQWTQIFVKYIDVIEKFRYLEKCHALLKNETMSEDQFVFEVEALFTEGNTFLYMLHKFDLMMTGAGFGDTSNILDILRKSLLTQDQGQTLVCSESYSERIDYFIRLMFAMEMEAVLGWEKYRLVRLEQGKIVTPEEMGFGSFISNITSQGSQLKDDMDIVPIYKDYTAKQWSLFNRNGCGSLKPELLSNNYCEKPYHSTDQQEVALACQNDYKPFPQTVQCSKGKWSALPVCYTRAGGKSGSTTCKSDNGVTVCTASCLSGSAFADGQTSETYQCNKQPCPSFTPRACNRCTSDVGCERSEVCHNGGCVDGCSVYSCGVNAQCSTTNHVQSCHCVSPWILWKGEQPHGEGCRYQELEWKSRSSSDPLPESIGIEDKEVLDELLKLKTNKAASPDGIYPRVLKELGLIIFEPLAAIFKQYLETGEIPEDWKQDAVKSLTGIHVCRAKGPDGSLHGGWVWFRQNTIRRCNYEFAWDEKSASSFEVLVDPCGGSGVYWTGGGINYDDGVATGPAIDMPGITYFVCSRKSNGFPGKLFRTKDGPMCHYGYHGQGDREKPFDSLVIKQCDV